MIILLVYLITVMLSVCREFGHAGVTPAWVLNLLRAISTTATTTTTAATTTTTTEAAASTTKSSLHRDGDRYSDSVLGNPKHAHDPGSPGTAK
jgi:hypothetical protein